MGKIVVLDKSTMFEFNCETQEGAEHIARAIELLGGDAFIWVRP